LLKLTSTLSQYLDGAPIEKKTVAKLVRRASLNAVPFDFKKDTNQLLNPETKQKNPSQEDDRRDKNIRSQRNPGGPAPTPQTPSRAESQDPQELTSPFNTDFLSPVSHHHHHNSHLLGTPYRIDIPSMSSSHRNPCDFIYLGDTVEEQCDYLFYRVYTLSHPNHSSPNPVEGGKDYNEAKRDVLNEWIGKRTFLSMCLALDVIDERSVREIEVTIFSRLITIFCSAFLCSAV
jgi:hypothetical protein